MTNYQLKLDQGKGRRKKILPALKKFYPFIAEEKKLLLLALLAILADSSIGLVSPFLIGRGVDAYIQTKQFQGVLLFAGILLSLFLFGLVAAYFQTKLMGTVGQRLLFNLRQEIFRKLQELPVAFFDQNRIGDLISRINNDTDRLNQFFSQALVQFMRNIISVVGVSIFILVINVELGSAALVPALILFVFTQLVSPWVKKKNAVNLQTNGAMSAEIQESLNNFKVIVAFDRRDYFRQKFAQANQENYSTAIVSGLANNVLTPIYGLSSSLAQLITLTFGLYLITSGHFTVGLLISFLVYTNNLYTPLRHIAMLWASFQTALASWDRIAAILELKSDLKIIPGQAEANDNAASWLEFKNVYFAYPDGQEVLRDINLHLEKGKTYALVGPTGGGKTTTASLMARLYDPTQGQVIFAGRDLRSYEAADRTARIGFILQEPFIFQGTLRDNILYGNDRYQIYSSDQIKELITSKYLDKLLSRFEKGLDTLLSAGSEALSLGQKQLIAFMRAVLREPELLILDEATANIDTVTEKLLDEILDKLPPTTTKVIIAHRLNTIESADEIYFINAGVITRAGSLAHAMEMLTKNKRKS